MEVKFKHDKSFSELHFYIVFAAIQELPWFLNGDLSKSLHV